MRQPTDLAQRRARQALPPDADLESSVSILTEVVAHLNERVQILEARAELCRSTHYSSSVVVSPNS